MNTLTIREMCAEMFDLTEKQARVFLFIAQRVYRTGVSPSLREIMRHFALKSPNGARCHLLALKKKGAVSWDGDKSARVIVPRCRFVPAEELMR